MRVNSLLLYDLIADKMTDKDFLSKISLRRRKNLQNKILEWYLSNKRDLPWRKSSEPYRIWISEIMLQQTQVIKVIEYYEPFLKKFKTVHKLADASLDEVLKAWEGMGYYTRARNLHKASKYISANLNGKIPDSYERLLQIPGIGPYTAAAIASIAFNMNHAVVDGNVERVLSRIFAIDIFPKSTEGKKLFSTIAQIFLLQGKARHWNQALMELGALICTPGKPNCTTCPTQKYCCAYQKFDDPSCLPVRPVRPPRPHHSVAAGLVWNHGRLLIAQRKEQGLLGGLWEFPGGKIDAQEKQTQALQRILQQKVSIKVKDKKPFLVVEHGFTHFKMTIYVYHCEYKKSLSVQNSPDTNYERWKWIYPSEFKLYAFSAAHRRIINEIIKTFKSQ